MRLQDVMYKIAVNVSLETTALLDLKHPPFVQLGITVRLGQVILNLAQ